MKTQIISLVGDPIVNLHQLGLRERDSFLLLEERVTRLLSTNPFLRYSHDILTKTRHLFRKNEEGFFYQAVSAYAEGMGILPVRYFSFLSLFEVAAHYGHAYPELKGLLPGCTSVLTSKGDEIGHTRLLDFPLQGIFEEKPRLYYWKPDTGPALLSYGCEGMAPVFLQGLHGSGVSFAVHHKPGTVPHREGQSIFQIVFESLFMAENFPEIKKEIRKRSSVTKWGLIFLDKSGATLALDIDGPSQSTETFNVKESSPLIFTNIPLQREPENHDHLIQFSEARQNWLKEKLPRQKSAHLLDLLLDVNQQKSKGWNHPAATLSTVGACHINLTKGLFDLKEGTGALTSSDATIRFHLDNSKQPEVLKEKESPTKFEESWKRASMAQSAFDRGDFDIAYHELQMARSMTDNSLWENIFSFFLYVWDFRFVSNNKELSLIYKRARTLEVPELLKDQWTLLIMRMEKKLDLSPTVTVQDVSEIHRGLFLQEKLASKAVFATWMKLLYPRLEILDVFSPHRK